MTCSVRAMNIILLMLLLGAGFVALLLVGRSQIARGINAEVANGAMAMVLAVILGIFFMGAVLSS